MADLIDNLCQATQIIVDKAIEELKFDKTVTGKIIDNSKANIGEYTIKEGVVEYIAYSENTSYKIDDAVYVTIPNGDYSQQKMITGKVIVNEETYITSNSLDSFLDITGNLILDKTAIGRLIANHTDISKQEVLIDSQLFDENALVNYTRLAISVDVKTNLNAWKVKEGKYGIRIDISTYDNDEIKTLNFSNKNMFGNVYNFTTFQTQTMIFDISSITNIKSISISFYQEENSFKTNDGELIPFKDDMGFDIAPNLLLKNISLSLGYDKSEFEVGVDKVLLSCNDSKVYNKTLEEEYYRSIKLTWIHWDEQNNLYPITSETNNFDFDIRWYRYRLSAQAVEELAQAYNAETGVFDTDEIQQLKEEIEQLEIQKEQLLANADEEGNLNPEDIIKYDDYLNQIESLSQQKSILLNQIFRDEQGNLISDLYMDNNWEYQDVYTQLFNYYFLPYANREEEQIVAIIIQYDEEGNKTIHKSEPLVFKNANPVLENSSANSGLKLTFMDETEGNYFIYNKNNRITDLRESVKIRTIKVDLVQNTGLETSLLDENCVIKWTYPENDSNTMIQVIETNNNELTYKIKETYSSWQVENTIACEIVKDGESFYGSQSLNFGIAGTNGSDATLVISFTNNKRTLESNGSFYYQRAIQAHSPESVQFKLELFNSKGKLIELSDKCTVTWHLEGLNGDWEISTDVTEEGNNDLPILWGGISDAILIPPISGFEINDHLILVATVTGYTNYPLVTKFPIPITANVEDFNYINGPTEVIYSTVGSPIAFDTPYKLFTCGNAVHTNAKWIISNGGKYTGTLSENNILQPLIIYMPDAPKYGVLATINEVPVWYQPILVMQNAFGSTTLNNWSGKTIELNEDEGTIVSPAIAAGKKEEDNSFSGIMMGDWSVSDTSQEISAQTGLYGFHKGAVSFAFTEDGKGFIGKSGKGRIEFDGDKSIIKNSGYDTIDGNGMLIDLDDPYISLKRYGNEVVLINSKTSDNKFKKDDAYPSYKEQPYFKITDSKANPLIYIGENHFYLASAYYLKPISTPEGGEITADSIINNPYNDKQLQTINGTYLDFKEGFFLTKWGILGNLYFDQKGITSVEKISSLSSSGDRNQITTVSISNGTSMEGIIISSGHEWEEKSEYSNPGIYTAGVSIYNEFLKCKGKAEFYGPTVFEGSVQTNKGIYEFIKQIPLVGTGTIKNGYTTCTFSGTINPENKGYYDCIGISSIVLSSEKSNRVSIVSYSVTPTGQYSICVSRYPEAKGDLKLDFSCVILCVQQSKLSEVDKLTIGEVTSGDQGIKIPSPIDGPEGPVEEGDEYDQYSVLAKDIRDLNKKIAINTEEIETINSILKVSDKYYNNNIFHVVDKNNGDIRLRTINEILDRIAALPVPKQ